MVKDFFEGPRADGCSVADLTHAFRWIFKLNIQLAIAGLGAMMLTAGHPYESRAR